MIGRISRCLALDYSNIEDWTGDLVVGNVNLVRDWKIQLLEFQRAVSKIDVDFEINVLEKSGVTLKNHNQRLVGLAENNCLQEGEEKMTTYVTDVHVQDEADLLAELITPRVSPYDYMVEIDGEMVYKETTQEVDSFNPLSQDQLRRIQGLTTYHGLHGQNSHEDCCRTRAVAQS